MAGIVVGWACRQHTGSPTTKLVLMKLADNANEQGYCYPSVRLICRHTELSMTSVRKALKTLETLGLIDVIREQDGGVNLSNKYQLSVPDFDHPVEKDKGKGGISPGDIPPRQARGGTSRRGRGVVRDAHDIDKPSKEPSFNQRRVPARRDRRGDAAVWEAIAAKLEPNMVLKLETWEPEVTVNGNEAVLAFPKRWHEQHVHSLRRPVAAALGMPVRFTFEGRESSGPL